MGPTRSLQRRRWVAAVGVAVLAAPVTGCSHGSGSAPRSGAPVGGATRAATVSVDGPAAAFPHGRPPVVVEPIPQGFEKLIAGPVVQIGHDTDQPAVPVTLRFPAPAGGVAAHIAYRDETSGWWLPVPTAVDKATGQLIAVVDHYSWWTTIRDKIIDLTSKAPGGVTTAASWLEYEGGLVLGVRAAKPSCSGKPPPWVVGDILTVPDPNAELFACGEAVGDKLRLKVVNNRGYPVTVEFSRPFARVRGGLPTSLRDLVQTVASPSSTTRVFLVSQGDAEVEFARPDGGGGVVQGYVRRDAGTMLTDVVFDLVSAAGGDLPVGGGKTLGLSTVECLATTASSEFDTVEALQSHNAKEVEQAVTDLRGCADGVIGTEMRTAAPGTSLYNRLRSASRFIKALQAYNFEMIALDAFVNDSTTAADLVDVSFRWLGQPKPASLGLLVADWFRHVSGLTIKADGTGSYLERTYTPCGTSQDCTYTAKLKIAPGGTASTGVITFYDVAYKDGDQVMTVTAAEHRELDPYFPLEGEQADVRVDSSGRLKLVWHGRLAHQGKRSDDGNTFCNSRTQPGQTYPCGA
jgi:hypothetical protein